MIHPEEPAATQEREFQAALIDYIRDQWGELLGSHITLLDQEDGLEQLSALLRSGALEKNRFQESSGRFFST